MAKRAARLSGRRGEGGYAAHVVAALAQPTAAAFATPAETAAALERGLQRRRALAAAQRKAGTAAFVARVRAAVAGGGGDVGGVGGGGGAPPPPPPHAAPAPQLNHPPAAVPAVKRGTVQDNLPERCAPPPATAPPPQWPVAPLLVVPLSPSKGGRRPREGTENEGGAPPPPHQQLQQQRGAPAPQTKGVVARLRSLMGW